MTEAKLAEIETWAQANRDCGGIMCEYILELCAEIRRLWARERELLEANNVEVEKRRAAEKRTELMRQAKNYWLERAVAAEAGPAEVDR